MYIKYKQFTVDSALTICYYDIPPLKRAATKEVAEYNSSVKMHQMNCNKLFEK